MMGTGTWCVPPGALSIFHRLWRHTTQEENVSMALKVIWNLNKPLLRQRTLNLSAEIAVTYNGENWENVTGHRDAQGYKKMWQVSVVGVTSRCCCNLSLGALPGLVDFKPFRPATCISSKPAQLNSFRCFHITTSGQWRMFIDLAFLKKKKKLRFCFRPTRR